MELTAARGLGNRDPIHLKGGGLHPVLLSQRSGERWPQKRHADALRNRPSIGQKGCPPPLV